MKIDEKNDFGFSFADEGEINLPVKQAIDGRTMILEERVDFTKRQLKELHDNIKVLLTNLKKDPEKEFIKWPNRIEKIKAFEIKLEAIVNRQMDLDEFK